MKKTLLVLFVLTNLFAFAQEETFRVKPWKKYAGYYEQNKIVISEEGKLIDFPQFLFFEKVIDKNCKDPKYLFDPNLIQFSNDKEERLSLKQFQMRVINEVEVKLKYILSLNNDFAGNWNAEQMSKDKKVIESLLRTQNLTLTGYCSAITKILSGTAINDNYKKVFPDSLYLMFNSDSASKYFVNALIEIKATHNDLPGLCTCKEKEIIQCSLDAHDTLLNNIELKGCNHSGKFNFNIRMDNPYLKLFENTIAKVKFYMDSGVVIEYNSITEKLAQLDAEFKALETDKCKSSYNEVVVLLKSIENSIRNLDSDPVGNYWSLSWLWFNGKVKDDPFMDELPDVFDTKYSKKDVSKLESKIEAYKLMLNGASASEDARMEEWANTYTKLIDRKDSIQEIIKKKDAYAKKYKKLNEKYFFDSSQLYDGIFYLSKRDDKHLMRNHDGSNEFKAYEDQREDYYGFEAIHYLSHNHNNSKNVKLTTSGEVISNHKPSWVEEANASFDGLNSLFSLDPEIAQSQLKEFLKSKSQKIEIRDKTKEFGTFDCEQFGSNDYQILKDDIDSLKKVWDDNKESVRERLLKGKKVDWIKMRLELKPVKVVGGKTIEITPESKGYKLSSDVSYTFSTFKDDGTADKAYPFVKAFRHYKKSYVQLYGGLNASLTNVDRVVIADEDAEQVDPKIESDPFQFVAGIKVYPWGGVIEDNRFMAINKHRLHVNLGFSIPKPLANIYTGIGYDIIPGWNINFNAHFYQDKEYIIVDGEVEHSRSIYRPGFAIGTGMDVSVFVNAVKFFFK